jgi:5'-nucleotidase (lipoprotein e(P4) family)
MKMHEVTKFTTLAALASLGTTACGTVKPAHDTIDALLWMQTSAEYEALTTSIYSAASDRLVTALADPDWTAAREQQPDYQSLPPAVILDVDETVLDNTAYGARTIRDGTAYTPDTWTAWCRETRAGAVPGSLAFTKLAQRNGITVFYLTNRDHDVEEATRQNLDALGFPLDSEEDTVLTRHEKPDWGSSKVKRREFITARYRVLLLFGDDFNDFAPSRGMPARERIERLREFAPFWGYKWYLLPNPTYGSWSSALFHGLENPGESERWQAKHDHLRMDEQ